MGLSCEISTMKRCNHGLIAHDCDMCQAQKQIKALTEMYKDLSCIVAGFSDHRIRQIDENRKISRRVDELELQIDNKSDKVDKKTLEGLQSRINDLEKSSAEIKIPYLFIERIEKLEIFHEEFKKCLKRDIERHQSMWSQVFSRLEKLEEKEDLFHPQHRKTLEGLQKQINDIIGLFTKGDLKLEDEIDELGRMLTAINESYNNLCASSLRKIPFRCPICLGDGNHPDQSTRLDCKVFIDTGIYVCNSCEGKGIIWG